MPCNLSFLSPQQLAFYALQMQSQQQSPTAISSTLLNPINVGMVNQFIPAFIQQPFFGSLPLTTLPIIHAPTPNTSQLFQSPISQMGSKSDQTSPTLNFLHPSQTNFFNTPTTPNLSSSNLNSNIDSLLNLHQNHTHFTLVNNNNSLSSENDQVCIFKHAISGCLFSNIEL